MRFLTRVGCHLCEEARPIVTAAARKAKIPVDVIDVDTDDELRDVYGERVPVVLGPDGQVVAEGPIEDRGALRMALARLGG